MSLNCGIVGLPNVGKSTLFNALTATMKAQASNYAFCTIDPNVGKLDIPDERLDQLSEIQKPERTVPNQLEIVDIAGLVRGASKGEGLGNQFLDNIRKVDAILHVLRCFEDSDIMHVEGNINPVFDAEIVENELLISDLQSMERQIQKLGKKAKGVDKESQRLYELAEKAIEVLKEEKPVRLLYDQLNEDDRHLFKSFNLLTVKPVLYVCNVEEASAAKGNQYVKAVEDMAKSKNAQVVFLSAAIEAEIAQLSDPEERKEFLSSFHLTISGLQKVIQAGYKLLNLITFFTVGPKEVRAWTVHQGAKAPEAAGVIHTDFEKGFIKADTIAYEDFIKYQGEQGAKEAGRLRQEGKEYLVQDGDLFHFKFNV